MGIIAISNQKGGAGKTTTTVNLGAGLTRLGRRCLVVDLDPQAHLTHALGVDAGTLATGLWSVLSGQATAQQALIQTDGAYLLPAGSDLAQAELDPGALPGRETALVRALAPLAAQFDTILLDCPPNLGLLTLNALAAAQRVIIPMPCEYLALQSLGRLNQTLELARRGLELGGIAATRFGARKRHHQEVLASVRRHFGPALLDTQIRDNVSLAEAPSFGQDIFTYRPRSLGARDYLALSREIIARSLA